MGIVYILSNRWYGADHLYKIGLHHGSHIDDLVKQYQGRYMPEVDIIDFWEVGDCITSEQFVHRALVKDDGISRYKMTEWFQGDIDKIVQIVQSTINRCERDPLRVRIGERIYPLTLLPDDALSRLLLREQVDTFYPRTHPRWRRIGMLLLFLRSYVRDTFASRDVSNFRQLDSYVEEVSSLLGYPYDEDIIARLYLHVEPMPSDNDMQRIRNILNIDGEDRQELLGNMILASLPEREIFSTLTLTQLRNVAKDRGIVRSSALTREQLIALLTESGNSNLPP